MQLTNKNLLVPESSITVFCFMDDPMFICENENAATEATTRQLTLTIM